MRLTRKRLPTQDDDIIYNFHISPNNELFTQAPLQTIAADVKSLNSNDKKKPAAKKRQIVDDDSSKVGEAQGSKLVPAEGSNDADEDPPIPGYLFAVSTKTTLISDKSVASDNNDVFQNAPKDDGTNKIKWLDNMESWNHSNWSKFLTL